MEPRTRTKIAWAPNAGRSARQLKIEFDCRNHLAGLAIEPGRFCAPPLHRIDGRVGQHRLAFQNLLHLYAAVLRELYLQGYKTVDSRALGKRRIERGRSIREAFQK